jgi:HD-GYP domain-containing protein (c-di-GMP phosphodiesterase class II)
MLRQIFVIVLLWLVGISGFCQTPMRSDSTEIPNFEKCFRLLEENRRIYNQYNDSIFLFRDHVAWTNFFKRRALKNTHIFLTNNKIISTVFDYFRQDRGKIPHEAYRLLCDGLQRLYLDEKIDPFLGNELCDILLDYYRSGRCPEHQNYAGWVDCMKGEFLFHIYTLGKEPDALKKSYEYLKCAINEDRCYSPNSVESCLFALENLTITNWLNYKMQTVEEYRAYIAEFRRLLQMPQTFQLMNQKIYARQKQKADNAEERLIRNAYLADTTIMEKLHADSLMQEIVARNLANPHLSELSISRTLVMQVLMGQLTAKEAMKLVRKKYRQDLRKRINNERFDHNELQNVLLPFMNYLYLNDVSDVSFRRKRAAVKRMYQDIITIYHHRLDQQTENLYVKYLNILSTYPRALKYLKEEERIRNLNELNVATQVTTYAHSAHVAMIARKLMEGILKYQPDLLKGALGQIRRGKLLLDTKECLEFISEAALYHDIGKNGIISAVNNDYRPLTDEEHAIIKTHPALGAELLKIAPSLYEKYHDTTLGHHKWYNGKGGYPDDFDNTKSPKRILIDIITLSDCMQAATERIGRNYKTGKTFDMVMEEFRRDAGTKYNPDLVKFIDAHDDVARDLAVLINDAWVDIYFNIYSKFMR